MKNVNLILTEVTKSYESDDKWIVEGYIATSDFDLQGDVITKEALIDLSGQLQKTANTLCYLHNQSEPIGRVIKTWVEEIGSRCRLGMRCLISKTAPIRWQQIKEGVLNKFSIRGRILEKEMTSDSDNRPVRVVNKILAIEPSLVPIPGNMNAEQARWYITKSLEQNGGTMSEETKKVEGTEEPVKAPETVETTPEQNDENAIQKELEAKEAAEKEAIVKEFEAGDPAKLSEMAEKAMMSSLTDVMKAIEDVMATDSLEIAKSLVKAMKEKLPPYFFYYHKYLPKYGKKDEAVKECAPETEEEKNKKETVKKEAPELENLGPRTDLERVMNHYKVSKEEAENMLKEKSADELLPPRGSAGKGAVSKSEEGNKDTKDSQLQSTKQIEELLKSFGDQLTETIVQKVITQVSKERTTEANGSEDLVKGLKDEFSKLPAEDKLRVYLNSKK